MVLIGIFNSRLGIGIEIFKNNLIYGSLAYLFLAFSGLTIVKLLQDSNNPKTKGKFTEKRVIMIFGIFFLISFILTIVNVIENTIIYSFNIIIIFCTVLIVILWMLLGFYGYKYRKHIPIINVLMVTLIFSLGIIYGVFLNTDLIPIHIYFFFISIAFLQLSRELTKGFSKRENEIDFFQNNNRLIDSKLLKFSLSFQVFSIIFLILPFFNYIMLTALTVFLLIFNLIIMGFASFLTISSIIESDIYKKISSILKIAILLELILLLITGN